MKRSILLTIYDSKREYMDDIEYAGLYTNFITLESCVISFLKKKLSINSAIVLFNHVQNLRKNLTLSVGQFDIYIQDIELNKIYKG